MPSVPVDRFRGGWKRRPGSKNQGKTSGSETTAGGPKGGQGQTLRVLSQPATNIGPVGGGEEEINRMLTRSRKDLVESGKRGEGAGNSA